MKKLGLFTISILFFPFYTLAFSDIETLDEMQECLNRESNKCINAKQSCGNSCGWENTECIERCYIEMEKCIDYSHRVKTKYDECHSEYESFIFGKNKVANAKDFCDGKIMFASCMDNFSGLCKMSWPHNCNDQSGKIEDTYDENNNLDEDHIGLPVNSGANTSPCVGKTPKNSEFCPGDDKEIYYYAENKLTDVCSIPEGSEPKCEYICQNGYDFVEGECKNSGFFARIINWLGSLF
ncbi:MAG: hypothetical protein A2271_01950 [Candidatus Moranbacteria bacterium RIFOXYA12_FULL_35_19]|nr:MAG: hypothetical protein UR78_C0011G0019 [Candidatus Moranbacteria bacterium GW2011_GWF2_35_39]OGI33450.1 MAG: hypothetical protein A2489_03670 [Candidatus Moranbacteria bacterium RIFOXYC12_FULL_36_13]OGI36547.1 MAG: hypothetical protein A2271_01950 [Candidatus Moranbacteria bacterium RIFOXYA12_FULL_35_19]